ncbi:MAG TPA: protein kinase [Candidatus Eisenbacteria bacterium]|nr:protein kinase [Candidatus Eisenbacteria bacterium]
MSGTARLAPGTRLGPYEIVAPLGAGGMGEVYRARDPRLGREVAVKVLPRAFASDPDRQRRFEAEARAAGALNHPNIVTLFDVGATDGTPYLVTEVLEGETLRALLSRGPLAPARAAALLGQAALGLAAAHAKGIVHRDLKPENLFVLPDGRVKVLDFGIAKLVAGEASAAAETTPVFASMTASGTILGTVSYMAPEQLRDQTVDHRADLFALGAILYELVSGRLAFPADTAADRVTAILTADPKTLDPAVEAAMPGLSELIRRCLEKRPETRFESARDLAYALEILAGASGSSRQPMEAPVGTPTAGLSLKIRQLTFREGYLSEARFAPDGVTVVYRAAWEGQPPRIFLSRTDNPDYQPLQLGNAELLAVSSTAELAVGLNPRDMGGFIQLHTLARVSMLGGVPRELAKDVFMADWGPGGRSLAAIRLVDGRFRLEYPLGTVVHETSGWFSRIRVAPSGKQIAFFEHPVTGDNAGDLKIVEPGRPTRTLVTGLNSAGTLAWRPDGSEIWYSATAEGEGAGLIYAVTLEGRVRVVYQTLGWPVLYDFSQSGDALIGRMKPRLRLQTGTRSAAGADTVELSWLDWSLARDLTEDGSMALFDETGPGVMHGAAVYVRSTDGSAAIRIGEGVGMGLMPDGLHALTIEVIDSERVVGICPLGAGEPRRIRLGGVVTHFGRPFPDGRTAVIVGHEPGQGGGLYRLDLETGGLERITREPITVRHARPTPDGSAVLASRADGTYALFPVDGGPSRAVPGLESDERPSQFTEDGRHVYTFRRGVVPCPVARVDVETGRREPWFEIEPVTRNGTDSFISVLFTPDGERYIASFGQYVNDLFLVSDLR